MVVQSRARGLSWTRLQPRPLGAVTSGGVRENDAALCRCSVFLIGFVLPNMTFCIDIGFNVANVPQHLRLGLVGLRCVRSRRHGVRVNGPA